MTISDHTADNLVFLPLGGSGEIGMNFNLLGLDGKWIAVDCGISFGDDRMPGIDVVMADPTLIAEERENLLGIVLTHAHEDHVGAIPYLWPRLRCPIYATPFTAAFLRLKLQETDFADQVKIVEIELGGRRTLGPFDIEFVTVTHSIPEPNALAIRTRLGTVVHSGDWKLDPQPLIGETSDEAKLRRLGDEGVDVLICDSTNAMEDGHSRSEGEVRDGLTALFKRRKSGRIAITCFSSNVARINAIAHAAHAAGRNCALVGRSLWRIHAAASSTGYIDTPEPLITEHDAGYLPEDKVVLIVAGSQGEPRSALTRIAHDDHPEVSLGPGDAVVYSARDIPGNEKAILRVQNALAARGVEVITADDVPADQPIHASGHPKRDELLQMYQWLRPKAAVPTHGEMRHMKAHEALARSAQVKATLIPEDGALIRLLPGPLEVLERFEVDRIAFDGGRLLRLHGGAMQTRARLSFAGAATVALALNGKGHVVGEPSVTLLGIENDEEAAALEEDLAEYALDAVEALSARDRRDDEMVREEVRVGVRRALRKLTGKKPITTVHLIRV
ncbi:MAG: ribonuclease J [Azospirillaceae bacterium]